MRRCLTLEGAGNALVVEGGVYLDPSEVPISLVPEPGTLMLLAAGVALGLTVRRRSR